MKNRLQFKINIKKFAKVTLIVFAFVLFGSATAVLAKGGQGNPALNGYLLDHGATGKAIFSTFKYTNAIATITSTKLYTDVKSGISFVIPPGWKVGTDESGDTYTYNDDNNHLTVDFKAFTNKQSWKEAISYLVPISSGDILMKNKNVTVGGFPAQWLVFKRSYGLVQNTDPESFFQYSEYFVDGGTKWYVIGTGEPTSEDIINIIKSIKFSN